MVEERSLRITGTNTTFFDKISKTLTKIMIPTKIGINGMLISIKRNSLLKAYEAYKSENNKNYNQDELEKKYDLAYETYLESLDKYVMDSIYKKVKNNTASEFEKNALSKYYEVTSLKENEYIEYKYRKQTGRSNQVSPLRSGFFPEERIRHGRLDESRGSAEMRLLLRRHQGLFRTLRIGLNAKDRNIAYWIRNVRIVYAD